MTLVDTVPTGKEASGDFSEAGVNIFNPNSSRANPDFNPSRPAGPTNPQFLRDPFPGNVIPSNLISPVAARMLSKYVVRPNTAGGMGLGMSMNGAPVVVGAGLDSNNFIDARNHRNVQDQGTVRIDRILGAGDNIFGRYTVSGENGFMPQNLPGRMRLPGHRDRDVSTRGENDD